MRRSLVVTFTGLDRPGIVETLARVVADGDGNWEGSRMTRRAGYFAGVLHASAPTLRADELARALEELSRDGLTVRVETGADAQATGERERLWLEVTGAERGGIVRAVSGVLAAHGVNILELVTAVVQAPIGGGELFRARLRIECPPEHTQETLIAALEELGDDITIDLEADEGGERGGRP